MHGDINNFQYPRRYEHNLALLLYTDLNVVVFELFICLVGKILGGGGCPPFPACSYQHVVIKLPVIGSYPIILINMKIIFAIFPLIFLVCPYKHSLVKKLMQIKIIIIIIIINFIPSQGFFYILIHCVFKKIKMERSRLKRNAYMNPAPLFAFTTQD